MAVSRPRHSLPVHVVERNILRAWDDGRHYVGTFEDARLMLESAECNWERFAFSTSQYRVKPGLRKWDRNLHHTRRALFCNIAQLAHLKWFSRGCALVERVAGNIRDAMSVYVTLHYWEDSMMCRGRAVREVDGRLYTETVIYADAWDGVYQCLLKESTHIK